MEKDCHNPDKIQKCCRNSDSCTEQGLTRIDGLYGLRRVLTAYAVSYSRTSKQAALSLSGALDELSRK